jgi:hypothetical protein
MADDFIVEEESSNRTFLYAAGGLAALLLLGLIAIVVVALTGRNGDGDNEIAIMNMTIEAQNALVTQTVAAMETIAAYTPTPSRVAPTAVPTKIPTFTPSPVPPTVTPSPVAQTPEAEGTSSAEASAPTVTPTPTAGPSGGELPASGMGMWGAIGAAIALIAVILIARRLRPAV